MRDIGRGSEVVAVMRKDFCDMWLKRLLVVFVGRDNKAIQQEKVLKCEMGKII